MPYSPKDHSPQDPYAKLMAEALAAQLRWAEAWQRAGEAAWQAWWEEYVRLWEDGAKLFVRPIPF